MYGLYMAREMFPQGVVYFSQDTHYSVLKNLRVLNYRNIMIRSLDNGEIDYTDLRETIRNQSASAGSRHGKHRHDDERARLTISTRSARFSRNWQSFIPTSTPMPHSAE